MRHTLLLTAFLIATACSGSNEEAAEGGGTGPATYDAAEEPPSTPEMPPAPAEPAQPPSGESAAAGTAVQVAMPQIAYTYRYAFRLPSDAVASVQEKHLKQCESLGPARCRVVDMTRSASSGDYVQGSLKLQVAAPIARAFGGRLVESAAKEGAETVDRGISAEDLSKQIVDTAARIRTKEALVARLTTLLETRSGNIAQAVEAERAINAAQEELEQARAWLIEMRGRVAMSTFEISYQSGAPLAGGLSDPVRKAFSDIGALFGRSLALIIMLVAAILPWAALLLLAAWLVRTVRRRLHRREEGEAPTTGDAPDEGV